LKYLVLSQARDGSTSVRDIIQGFVTMNGEDLSLGYLTDTYILWPALRKFICDRDSEPLYRVFSVWNQSIEVSQGLGFILPFVRTIFGRDLKIIRMVREPGAHVRSLFSQAQATPQYWVGYSTENLDDHPEHDKILRPTGVDFGEVSRGDWESWATTRRFEWFVAKQTELIDSHIRLFPNRMTVNTADLNETSTINSIGEFFDLDWRLAPSPSHVKRLAGVDMESASLSERMDIDQVWQTFDFHRAVREPDYAVMFAKRYLDRRWGDEPDTIRSVMEELAGGEKADDGLVPLDPDIEPAGEN
tara:strand:- start:123509 stop:124414 length:906 start_codon:yes stop_codon:yes gene_type:complete